jgi:putative flippase GtrA
VAGAVTKLIETLRTLFGILVREGIKFLGVGGVAWTVETYLFGILIYGPVWPLHKAQGPLDKNVLTAKAIAYCISVVVAWLGNRYWTFRHRRQSALRREIVLFAITNMIGLAIGLASIGISHSLGFTSHFADLIAGQVFGVGIAMIFRFWVYRTFIFNAVHPDEISSSPVPDDVSALDAQPVPEH